MENQHNTNASQVLKFYIEGQSDFTVSPLGNGHINQTFLVETPDNKFVLQQINQHVFPQPQVIVDNAQAIYQHLARCEDYPYDNIGPKLSLRGNLVECIDSEYWRAFDYIDACESIEVINDVTQAIKAARAFATFSGALANIDANALKPVIENFHDLPTRMAQLNLAISQDKAGRLNSAKALVEQFISQQCFIEKVASVVAKLPLRITHNDTKINNLLFDLSTGEPHAVIDLDTCMPGYLMHDFGDMVRTCCSSLPEDDFRTQEMTFKEDIYQGLLTGYQQGIGHMLSISERESLALGAQLMPFIIGSRFLTDYLNGDVYFGVSHPLHNLHRAANQFAFHQLLLKQIAS